MPFELIITVFLIILAASIAVFFCLIIRKRKKMRVSQEFSVRNVTFRAMGKKNDFWISKGKRFKFHVVDGNIVSFIDKSVSKKEIPYTFEGK